MIGPDLNGPLCLKRMWAWSTESEPCALPGVGTLIGAHRVGGGKAVIARVSPRRGAWGSEANRVSSNVTCLEMHFFCVRGS
jgi:hypothetical protein